MTSFDELMEAEAWSNIASRPPGPAATGFRAGIQHERTRLVTLIAHRILQLRGVKGAVAAGARQELLQLLDTIQAST